MTNEPKPSLSTLSPLQRLERAVSAQQSYAEALNRGLARFSSDLTRALEYQRATALSGEVSGLRQKEAGLLRQRRLYQRLGFPEAGMSALEARLLDVYGQQGAAMAETGTAYAGAGRTDIAGRLGAAQEEAGLKAASLMQDAARRRGDAELSDATARAGGLQAFLDYASRAGTPPAEMAAARAGLVGALHQKSQLEGERGDLAAYYRTQQELLRHETASRADHGSRTSPWGRPLPADADDHYPSGAGVSRLLQGVIGGQGLRGPLYSPLALTRQRQEGGAPDARLRDKMTIVVELKPPGKSEEVFLDQWAQLLAQRMAHWIRTAV